jgi:hypothetical protein
MRTYLLLGVVCGLGLMLVGCGSSDDSGGDSSASASSNSGSAPPPPPAAPSAPSASAAAAPATDPMAQTSYPMGDGYAPSGADPASAGLSGSGYAGTEGGAPADYTPPMDPSVGYPGGDGTVSGAAGFGLPEGTEGYGAAAALPPPRPKSLRERALLAFRRGQGEEAMELLSAHYLTNPSAGSELGRVMQWSPALRRPALASRIGIIVVYSAPFNFEGNPQPLGSAELEAALGSQEKAGEGNREGGGGIRRGGRRLGGSGDRPAGAPGGSAEMLGSGSGYGGEGNSQLPTTPEGELIYFTGEIGTKLVAKIKSQLESGAFGAIYKEALKDLPVAKVGGENGAGPMGDPRSMQSGSAGAFGPQSGGGEYGGADAAGAADGANPSGDGDGSGIHKGQLIPGVEFLGAVENMKEVGEVAKTTAVDAIIVFDVSVRPATASKFVNTDTKFRVVSSADVSKLLFTSSKLNNKQILEARKKKSGEDPVAQEIDKAVAALETNFKLTPLPALTPELVSKRINFLIAQKPPNATSLLLETRFFVVKKLLKPDEAVALTLNGVGEEQLDTLSRVLDGEDARERIAAALTGKRADGPNTPLEKFAAALAGVGGLAGLAPAPQLPVGNVAPANGTAYGPGGPSGPGGPRSGYPDGSRPPGAGYPDGSRPAGAGYPDGSRPAGAGFPGDSRPSGYPDGSRPAGLPSSGSGNPLSGPPTSAGLPAGGSGNPLSGPPTSAGLPAGGTGNPLGSGPPTSAGLPASGTGRPLSGPPTGAGLPAGGTGVPGNSGPPGAGKPPVTP